MDALADRRSAAAHVLLIDGGLDHDRVVPSDDLAHHLVRVLRLRDGDAVSLTDGAGGWRMARAVRARRTLELDATTAIRHEPRPDPPLVVATAIPKGDRADWLVQKVTEVGADAVELLHAEHSVVRWNPERAPRHVERLQRVADEALRQSRRVWRTVVTGPRPASDVLPTAAVAEPGGRPIAATDATIAIGPEGGWSARELATVSATVSLGQHILRTETAAVVGTALLVAVRH